MSQTKLFAVFFRCSKFSDSNAALFAYPCR